MMMGQIYSDREIERQNYRGNGQTVVFEDDGTDRQCYGIEG